MVDVRSIQCIHIFTIVVGIEFVSVSIFRSELSFITAAVIKLFIQC